MGDRGPSADDRAFLGLFADTDDIDDIADLDDVTGADGEPAEVIGDHRGAFGDYGATVDAGFIEALAGSKECKKWHKRACSELDSNETLVPEILIALAERQARADLRKYFSDLPQALVSAAFALADLLDVLEAPRIAGHVDGRGTKSVPDDLPCDDVAVAGRNHVLPVAR